ncbi:molybdopterin-dependent oxidoreductase [Arcobacter sp. LA11]|uniref:molybdopterin-dependent oxidoreductase n=1 Tax=Arcobacter sp. LA11 TaxID=1898176 RepID=UPI000934DDE5|nr:molybdopterin-dependent oxidoreductase [Arcobacter sp. LA11]
MKITRRNFLKGSAATATVVGASALNANPLGSLDITKKIPHATHFGAFYAKVKDGKVYDLEPQESDAGPTVLTKALIDRVYSPSRIKYPVVRKSFLEGKANNKELRGADEFVRVSWDEALDLVAKKLKDTPNKNIYNGSYGGWGHPGRVSRSNVLTGRFFNSIGGAVRTNGEYSNGAAGQVNPYIVGDMEVYSLQTAHEQFLENSEVIVLWGCDWLKDNKIDFAVANRKNDDYFKKYKKSGIKFISIDPISTQSSKFFGAEEIKIRPNTDIALMLAMMNHLYKTNKYDKKFVEKYTDGFDKFLPYLLGKKDGIDKTPEWAAKITEIPAKKIKELAELFVSKKTFLSGNWANQRAHHGEQADWGIITLASMLGKIGLPGQGFGFSMHYAGGGQARSGKKIVPGLSQGKGKVKDFVPASRISDMLLNPGKTIEYKGNPVTYNKIDVMYVCGSNVVGHHPDTNELVEAMRKPDMVVVHEPWWTSTARMADVVFPSTTTFERDDLTFGGSYSQDYVYAMRKVIEPLYESRDDFEIFADIAKRIGKKEHKKFTKKRSQMDWIKYLYGKTDASKTVSFEDFWAKGYVKYEIPEEAYKFVRHSAFRKDPVKNALKTESGKIQIYLDKFEKFGYKDFKGHVTWFEPAEYLGSKESKEFPLHLVSPHPTYRIHSQLDNTWVSRFHKVNGREPIRINPADAKKYSITDGELVEVYNNRGRILAGAVVTNDIRAGVAAIEEGAWYMPVNPKENKSLCNNGQVNVLTSSRPTSTMAQATSVNTTLVAVKPYKGEVKPNDVAISPKIILS